MKSIKIDSYIFLVKPGLLLLFSIFFLSNGAVLAQEKKKKKGPGFDVRFKLATTYDDNILKYSEKYLNRFMNGEDEGRFHIDTYDDLILLTSLQITSTYRLFGKLKSQINGEVSRRTYVVNDIKSWNYITFGFRQYLPNRISFKLLYSYIPDFYVRHFRDEQWIDVYGYKPIAFQPYAFSKDNYGFYIQNYLFKNTRIKLSIYYSLYYHNEHYTEYDSENMTYGIQLYQPIHKKIKLEVGYQFITSDAKGYDASVETPETTDGPDATYEEDRFTFGFAWRLPGVLKLNHTFDAKCGFQNRYYSSKHPPVIDPLHAGRVDKNIRLYFNYKVKLNKS
ncbi:MAG: hypothetical protein K8S16_06265, partial [Bacteroidales bacterium]|nr:hypothetical protein [Bacteroidales bacterium]